MHPFSSTPKSWNELAASLPGAHLLQSWEWAQVKSKYGWQAMPFVWMDERDEPCAAAMVLKRIIPIGGFARKMCILYIPKGPMLDWKDGRLRARVLDDLQELARRSGAIFIKLDPDVQIGLGVPGEEGSVELEQGLTIRSELEKLGWMFSQDQIQFRNTVLIDLSPSEDELLGRMKQKTRYNIHLAQKKGVTVRRGKLEDLPMLYRLYAETSVRDGFVIRDEGYYQTVWKNFAQAEAGGEQPFHEPLIAEVEGRPISAVSLFYYAGQAVYLFGMSRAEHRELMPNHLLQWEAMRRAKSLGCRLYNLWGAPDEFDDNDPLWGVFRFKAGLGGYVSRTIGAWDFAASPMLYKLYTQTLPKVMDVMRWRGRAKTKQSLVN